MGSRTLHFSHPLHRGFAHRDSLSATRRDQAQRVGDLVESAVTRRRSCVGRRTRSPRPPARPAPYTTPPTRPDPHRHRTRTHRPYPAASRPTAFLATATRSRRCRHRPPSAGAPSGSQEPIEDRRPVTSHLLAPSERSIGMGGLLALVVVMKASKKRLEVVRVERRIEALHDNAQTAPSVRGHGRGLDRRRPAWRLLRGATQGTAPADRAPRATRDFALPAPAHRPCAADVSMIGLDPLAPETAEPPSRVSTRVARSCLIRSRASLHPSDSSGTQDVRCARRLVDDETRERGWRQTARLHAVSYEPGRTSGSEITAAMSRAMRSRSIGEVPAGAHTPYQIGKS